MNKSLKTITAGPPLVIVVMAVLLSLASAWTPDLLAERARMKHGYSSLHELDYLWAELVECAKFPRPLGCGPQYISPDTGYRYWE